MSDVIIFLRLFKKKSQPVLKLIASPTSPYVRKVRIALAEKGLQFALVTEVP